VTPELRPNNGTVQRWPRTIEDKGYPPAFEMRENSKMRAVPQMIRLRRPVMTCLLYHQGNRAFQDQFDPRLADRLEEKLARTV
jgi:hypothetical protein